MFPELVSMANGGVIIRFSGQLWFLPDPEMRQLMGELSGIQTPAQFAVQPAWCNPTAPIAPTLGGFYATTAMGLSDGYCHPNSAQQYNELWRETGRVFEARKQHELQQIVRELQQRYA